MTSRVATAVLIVFILSACSTPPAAPKKRIAPAPAKKEINVVIDPDNNKKPGGYYQNDGPATPPANTPIAAEPIPKNEPELPRANVPYTVEGEVVTPMQGKQAYREQGLASWYGKQFHGRKTASGEKFNMFAYSAAHRTLPIPSYARVTNPKNGKSAIVRINDRGPFHKKRLLDLSYAAALKLDIIKSGQATVLIERVFPDSAAINAAKTADSVEAPSADNDVANIDSNKHYWQLGAFKYIATAKHTANQIRSKLSSNGVIITQIAGYYRVLAGPFSTESEAENQRDNITNALGHSPFLFRPLKLATNP